MRWILIGFALAISSQVCADAGSCDSRVLSVKKYKDAIEWLRPLQGRFKVGQCVVEIQVCDPSNPKVDRGTLIGDILITDKNKFENYVPIHFELTQASKFQTQLRNSRVMFNYVVSDTQTNSVTGHREEARLEILKDWTKADHITQITMGTYTTKRDFWHLGRYTYLWSECFK